MRLAGLLAETLCMYIYILRMMEWQTFGHAMYWNVGWRICLEFMSSCSCGFVRPVLFYGVACFNPARFVHPGFIFCSWASMPQPDLYIIWYLFGEWWNSWSRHLQKYVVPLGVHAAPWFFILCYLFGEWWNSWSRHIVPLGVHAAPRCFILCY